MRHGAHAPFVLVVSPASPTTERLLDYFSHCGVHAELREDIAHLCADDRVTSLVVFPDSLATPFDAERLREVRRRFTRASLAFVTSDTRRYAELSAAMSRSDGRTCVVLPRPVWGHVLLDHVLAPPRRRSSPRAAPPPRSDPTA